MIDFYIIHNADENDIMKDKILPLFSEKELNVSVVKLNEKTKLYSLKPDAKIITFLNDDNLKKFLVLAFNKNWTIGLLPHPEMKQARLSYGISPKYDRALEDILKCEKAIKTDFLFCNQQPVLNSVHIGKSFSFFSKGNNESNIFKKIANLYQTLKSLKEMKHYSFSFETEKGKMLDTSALGVGVFQHGCSRVFSRITLDDTNISDGMLYALVFSPRSVLSLFKYFITFLLNPDKSQKKLPDFVGQIKTEKLNIKTKYPIEYNHDGKITEADEFSFTVSRKVLNIITGNNFINEGLESDKEIFRTSSLPKEDAILELTQKNIPLFNHSGTDEFKELFQNIRESSKASHAYLTLMVLATLLATIGLFANSTPVVIGAMILAPLMAPVIALAMGVLRQDKKIISDSLKSIILGTSLGLLISMIFTLLVPLKTINNEILARTSPNLLDLGVAIVSGIAGAYAYAKAEIAKSLAGVAIAVALVPPLAVMGIGMAWLDWGVFLGSSLLLLTNLVGITLAASITFMTLGYSPFTLARKGLFLTLMFVIFISYPLTMSFTRITEDLKIITAIKNIDLNGTAIKNINVISNNPLYISATLVTDKNIDIEKIDNIKQLFEEHLERPVKLQASVSYER